MTFSDFERTAKKYFPEIEVSKHGEFCNSKGKYTLGVKLNNFSKVYNYSGSYIEVLKKIGCPVESKSHYDELVCKLDMLVKENGTKDPFFGLEIDNSISIKDTKAEIERIKLLELL